MTSTVNVISVVLLVAAAYVAISNVSAKRKIHYVDMERINLTSWNPKYFSHFNMTVKRYSRSDPIHYMNFHFDILVPFNKDIYVDIVVYELRSNEYRRGFIELHLNVCNLVRNDTFIGPLLGGVSCPSPKGAYHLVNMSIPNQPLLSTFPMVKGRVFFNATWGKQREVMLEAFIDISLRQRAA